MSAANGDNLQLLVGKPCPHCGEKLSLKRTVFAHGACEERIWSDGHTEVYTDGTGRGGGLYFTRNKPWRCMDCGKKIANAGLESLAKGNK